MKQNTIMYVSVLRIKCTFLSLSYVMMEKTCGSGGSEKYWQGAALLRVPNAISDTWLFGSVSGMRGMEVRSFFRRPRACVRFPRQKVCHRSKILFLFLFLVVVAFPWFCRNFMIRYGCCCKVELKLGIWLRSENKEKSLSICFLSWFSTW